MKKNMMIVGAVLLMGLAWILYSKHLRETAENEVKSFCDSITAQKWDYAAAIEEAKSRQYRVVEFVEGAGSGMSENGPYQNPKPGEIVRYSRTDIQSPFEGQTAHDFTHVFDRWGMAYLSCYVQHEGNMVLATKFVANWDN